MVGFLVRQCAGLTGSTHTTYCSNMTKKRLKKHWHHFFLPHHKTHKKAHLISVKALLVYVLLFITLQFGFQGIAVVKPQVLGITSDINQQDLIKLTNEQRQKNGLPSLKENSALDKAAEEKAKNMFEENYWAHYSPSGKSPWDFISGSGYKYSYAGENLAKSFYTSKDVVDAWMASTMGHKENVLNKKYTEIGMAVMEGELNGQKTILVVQEFGTPVDYIAQTPSGSDSPKTTLTEGKSNTLAEIPVNAISRQQVKSVTSQPTSQPSLISGFSFDPFALTKTLGFSFMGIIIFLSLLDLYIIKRRKSAVVNVYSRHIPHLALLPVAANFLTQFGPGSIL